MLYDLWGEIYRSAHSLWNELTWIMDDFAHSEVTYFDFTLFCYENVLKF